MGRASRRRAEQRAAAVQGRPASAMEDRGVDRQQAGSARAHSERIVEALARRQARRPPFRRTPPAAEFALQRLRDLHQTRERLDQLIASEVIGLVGLGTDWGSIGRALGVSRQAARQRYGTSKR